MVQFQDNYLEEDNKEFEGLVYQLHTILVSVLKSGLVWFLDPNWAYITGTKTGPRPVQKCP